MHSFFKNCLSILLLSATIFYSSASAEVQCSGEVSFSVKRGEAESEQSVLFRREEARGSDEVQVKRALAKKLLLTQQEALHACRDRHENLSGCVASKYSSLTGTMQQMSFAARSKLESAISEDCKAQQGTCGEAKVTEPVCAAASSSASESGVASEGQADKPAEKSEKK